MKKREQSFKSEVKLQSTKEQVSNTNAFTSKFFGKRNAFPSPTSIGCSES